MNTNKKEKKKATEKIFLDRIDWMKIGLKT
jgi:hypothetical protein